MLHAFGGGARVGSRRSPDCVESNSFRLPHVRAARISRAFKFSRDERRYTSRQPKSAQKWLCAADSRKGVARRRQSPGREGTARSRACGKPEPLRSAGRPAFAGMTGEAPAYFSPSSCLRRNSSIGRTCTPSSSAALRHSSCATGMSRPCRNVSHSAFAEVAICRRQGWRRPTSPSSIPRMHSSRRSSPRSNRAGRSIAPRTTARIPGQEFGLSLHRLRRSAENRQSEEAVPRPLPLGPGAGQRQPVVGQALTRLVRARPAGRRGCCARSPCWGDSAPGWSRESRARGASAAPPRRGGSWPEAAARDC
jgi:hypothetical protein